MSLTPQSPLGQHLFTFVVMADTHVNQSEESSASPYPSTQLTNSRARWAIHAINQIAPDFVIHMGDLTNPVPSLPSYPQAVARFRELVAPLRCPIYFVPGNHDIGDKPVAWMPAKAVNDAYLDHYEQFFGPSYQAFEHKGCHFIIANTPLINSGLAREAAHAAWLEAEVTSRTGMRTFFFTHYPIYLTAPDEPSHYDNVDEPGRSWLLDQVERAQVEALFTAHVHNFFYNRHGDTDFYTVPAVAFVRHDYAEFFRADAAPEFARNDPSKLGFCVVQVFAGGHTVHLVRSNGATLSPAAQAPATGVRVFPPHPRQRAAAPLGVHLRHPWAEMTWIPATGGADEFARKLARNDYPLLALWEMGVRRLRVPLQDLTDPHTRSRLALLQQLGHQFTVYGYGAPVGEQRAALQRYADLIDAYELILDWHTLDATLATMRELQRDATIPTVLSRLRGKEDEVGTTQGRFYFHNIRHGFRPGDRELADPRLAQAAADGVIHGLAFHLPRVERPSVAIPAIAAAARQLGLRATGELRMVSDNPAEAFVDDVANANRVAEALVAASTQPDVAVFVDALIDVDRGYFARTGLYDRRYAPRLAGKVASHLAALLHKVGAQLTPWRAENSPDGTLDKIDIDRGRLLLLRQGDEPCILVLPEPTCIIAALPIAPAPDATQGQCHVVALDTGGGLDLSWQRDGTEIRLATTVVCTVPTWITIRA